jgi:hypothetical protein
MADPDKPTPIELLEDRYGSTLGSLSTNTNSDGVPTDLKDALALINGANTEKMEEDLAEAAIKGEGGGGSGLDAIVVAAKPAKGNRDAVPAKTIGNIIEASQGPYIAMAKLLDKYIRLVISGETE